MTRIIRRIDSAAAAPRRLAFETCERRLALSTTVESFVSVDAATDDFTMSPALAEGFFSFDATVQVRSTTNLKSDAPLGDLQIQGEFQGQTTSVWDRSILTNFALEPRSNSVSGTVDFTPLTPASDAATLSDPFPSAEAEIIVDRPPGQVIDPPGMSPGTTGDVALAQLFERDEICHDTGRGDRLATSQSTRTELAAHSIAMNASRTAASIPQIATKQGRETAFDLSERAGRRVASGDGDSIDGAAGPQAAAGERAVRARLAQPSRTSMRKRGTEPGEQVAVSPAASPTAFLREAASAAANQPESSRGGASAAIVRDAADGPELETTTVGLRAAARVPAAPHADRDEAFAELVVEPIGSPALASNERQRETSYWSLLAALAATGWAMRAGVLTQSSQDREETLPTPRA